MIQKSICLLSTKAYKSPFGKSVIRIKLQILMQDYFKLSVKKGSFEDKAIFENFYNNFDEFLESIDRNEIITNGINFEFEYSPLIRTLQRLGSNVLVLFKLMFLEKRVVIYGLPVGETCDIIISIMSLIPLIDQENFQFKDVSQIFKIQSIVKEKSKTKPFDSLLENFNFPFPIKEFCFFSPLVCLYQSDLISKLSSFFFATTNTLLTENKQVIEMDVLFDANSNKFSFYDPILNSVLALSNEDKNFINDIINRALVSLNSVFDDFLLMENESFQNEANKKSLNNKRHQEHLTIELFELYCKALVVDVLNDNSNHQSWNQNWVNLWKKTKNFTNWKKKVDPLIIYKNHSNLIHPGTLAQNPQNLISKGFEKLKQGISNVSSFTNNLISNLATETDDKLDINVLNVPVGNIKPDFIDKLAQPDEDDSEWLII